MRYEDLKDYTSRIQSCRFWTQEDPPCGRSRAVPPVVNEILPTQKYLIISSDPAADTDKQRDSDTPASDFACRFLALLFLGDDTSDRAEVALRHYSTLSTVFVRNFYWTHYCKCHAFGRPNSFCARNYLSHEIELAQPIELIVSLGSKPVDFLLGKRPLKDRVCRVLDYRGVPLIASLHPSKDWNTGRRDEYQFYETWKLVRGKIRLSPRDYQVLNMLGINLAL